MWKIVSEVVPVLYAIIFDGLSTTDLCINKGTSRRHFANRCVRKPLGNVKKSLSAVLFKLPCRQ